MPGAAAAAAELRAKGLGGFPVAKIHLKMQNKEQFPAGGSGLCLAVGLSAGVIQTPRGIPEWLTEAGGNKGPRTPWRQHVHPHSWAPQHTVHTARVHMCPSTHALTHTYRGLTLLLRKAQSVPLTTAAHTPHRHTYTNTGTRRAHLSQPTQRCTHKLRCAHAPPQAIHRSYSLRANTQLPYKHTPAVLPRAHMRSILARCYTDQKYSGGAKGPLPAC